MSGTAPKGQVRENIILRFAHPAASADRRPAKPDEHPWRMIPTAWLALSHRSLQACTLNEAATPRPPQRRTETLRSQEQPGMHMDLTRILEHSRRLSSRYRIDDGRKFRLKNINPDDVAHLKKPDKAEAEQALTVGVQALAALQDKLYAQHQWGVLLIFQAMDAAGKDGVIKHVMSGINPQGCQVFSFKHPSAQELEHDFLWRTMQSLPERGRIGIFNRSYYEEVLIVRVHPEILQAQNIPDELLNKKTIWQERYRSIVDLEKHLHRNGTRIIKFFLHLSKEEQRKRFLERIDNPDKNWKFSPADIEERKYWDQYMHAYEECLSATSTTNAPWYAVPADDKENARLIISQIILDTFKMLKLAYPKPSAEHQHELQSILHQLMKEGASRK